MGESRFIDEDGGAARIAISFYAGSATEETYRLYKVILNGSEYTATP
jgi:hypothetical protein